MATIENNSANTIIAGTNNNDSILSNGANVTIDSNSGDDLISLSSQADNNIVLYVLDNGNDTIYGFNGTSTLQISDGTDTYVSQKSGSDIIVAVGDDLIFLKDAAILSTVNIAGTFRNIPLVIGTDDNNDVNNTSEGAMIQALGGNDSIKSYRVRKNHSVYGGSNVTIIGGNGNDTIENVGDSDRAYTYCGNHVIIDGGTGDDYINNDGFDGYNSTLIGGDGYDNTIDNGIYCYNTSINGGAGNDSIQNSSKNVTSAMPLMTLWLERVGKLGIIM